MLVRKIKLPKIHNSGILALIDFLMVNQSPPKNSTPSTNPAVKHKISIKVSFIINVFIVMYFAIFFLHPVPSNDAAGYDSNKQKRKRPGERLRIIFIKPQSQSSPNHRRNRNRPADHPHHSQTRPNTVFLVLRLELPLFFLSDFFAKGLAFTTRFGAHFNDF